MKSAIFALIVILAASDGIEVQEARSVELVCVKEDGCLKDCALLYQPSNLRDATHLKYQDKHNGCIQSATGENCERNEQIRDCFTKDEPEVDELEDEEEATYTIYWHETINV
uniref:Salivary OBP/D7 family protein n=1 Tax=Simulium nigrimanum TaxID=683695 RepID=D1FQ56_SIMNI